MPLKIISKPGRAVKVTQLRCALPWQGNASAPIMVVVDPIVYDGENAPEARVPMSSKLLSALAPYMQKAGIRGNDCVFISACTPINKDVWASDSRLNKALKADHEKFLEAYSSLKPRLVIAQGKAAIRQVLDRPAKITKMRGVSFHDEKLKCIVMPMLGLGHVLRVPEHGELFQADLLTAARIVKAGYRDTEQKRAKNYKWVTDLSELIARKPKALSVDTETSTFVDHQFAHWYDTRTKVLCVQLTAQAGESYLVPIDYPGFPIPVPVRTKLVRQLKQLLEDPGIEVFGQNFKYDYLILLRKLGIKVANWSDDILLLAHMLNENMLSKALDDIARVWLPLMAGYKDEFRRKYPDQGRMDLVHPDDMRDYGGGDSDATFQLRSILLQKIKTDPKLYNCYQRVVMPALRAFCSIEQRGFKVNAKALEELRQLVAAKQDRERERLMAMIPESIKAEFRDTGVGLKLTRDALLRAFLFTHKDGLKLKPLQFTKSKDKNGNQVPSVSSKTHLPYFIGKHKFIFEKDAATGEERGIIPYIKNDKLLTTYIGEKSENSGFWKYIFDGFVRPSYVLHGTVTGRSASRDPNGQNFPKRGEFAKAYRKIFEAPEGWVLLEADYSQLELRIAGILAKEPTFLRIYREGGDIHCMTAAVVMGISFEAFMKLKETDPEKFQLSRFRAKAVNFGFVYGMGWKKFKVYAKTEYGIDYTDDEAQRIRTAFFGKYHLEGWHVATREFVREHKYVRCLDGRVRHLPAVVVDDDGVASSAERQAINSPVQGFGSDLGLIALARINAELPIEFVQIVGFVHDAIICIAKKGREVEAAREIKRYMESNPVKEWFNFNSPIPITAEVSLGMNLASMTELKDAWLDDPKVTTLEQVQELAGKGKKPAKKFRIIKLDQLRKAA